MADVVVMKHGRRVPIPATAPLVIEVGVRGFPGGRGPKGDRFQFEDLTPEQKEELRKALAVGVPKATILTYFYPDVTVEKMSSYRKK